MSYEEYNRPRRITFKKFPMIAPRKEGFMVMHRIMTILWQHIPDDDVIIFPRKRFMWVCRERWRVIDGKYVRRGGQS